ncbi:hypothetical protein ABL78_4124 [Leptomonas seymouri]|uniref:Translin-associated factor X-interacting protein 1 N-terminal domain-containing protein n=1 Tax=Leptomonas seymouri TaxID=5684 RepID=A0A0N1IKY0_LEPSE|nr:hypothetical protein ABL78_4124 [Leptomonas seymouri]|eukprot:KPI86800.1 hypothetical protein ABL78_4124 [Leptomonas seymouri]
MLNVRTESTTFMRNGAVRHAGAPFAHCRGLQKPRRDAPSADRGAYHLPPLNPPAPPVPTAAAPKRASDGDTTAGLPLTVSSSSAAAAVAAPQRPLTVSRPLANAVQMWPAVKSTRQRRYQIAHESKAPLSLQLEGFIRREHQQYIREHPTCSRTDTLFIFREALATFVNHFSEYRGVLYLIRDEYDAALGEMTEKAKQMQVEYLESQSDRGLHAMELMQLKESMNATISNQQAQLGVLQGLVHSLRDQLTAAEHANSMLTVEMEQKKKTYVEAQQQVKLLSRAMIEETARTAAERERVQKLEKDAQLQESRIKVLQGDVAELEECVRVQAYSLGESQDSCWPSSKSTGLPLRRNTLRRGSIAAVSADGEAAAGNASSDYVSCLLSRIDALEMKVQLHTQQVGTAEARKSEVKVLSPTNVEGRCAAFITNGANGAPSTSLAGTTASVDALFPVVRQWLQMEGIGEAEIAPTDVIVPPGHCTSEDMGFLSVVQPIKHRHLSLNVTLQLLKAMWVARELPTTEKTHLRQFFLEWLRTQAADVTEAKELGINILDTCQHNLHHPECRVLLLVLREYLPEELVHVWRRRLELLQLPAQVSPSTLLDKMPYEHFFAHVRAVCPEKSIASMLQLRFAVYHRYVDADLQVTLSEVFQADSYFVRLLKLQWLQEVEKFTLQVVEGIREVADEKRNVVSLVKAMNVMYSLDPALDDEAVQRYISQGCKKSVIDVATADEGVTTHLDLMLARFRSTVLLQRRSPEDAAEQ